MGDAVQTHPAQGRITPRTERRSQEYPTGDAPYGPGAQTHNAVSVTSCENHILKPSDTNFPFRRDITLEAALLREHQQQRNEPTYLLQCIQTHQVRQDTQLHLGFGGAFIGSSSKTEVRCSPNAKAQQISRMGWESLIRPGVVQKMVVCPRKLLEPRRSGEEQPARGCSSSTTPLLSHRPGRIQGSLAMEPARLSSSPVTARLLWRTVP